MRKALVASSILSCVALAGCRDKAPEVAAPTVPTTSPAPNIAAKIAAARTATSASASITVTAISEATTNGASTRTTQTANIDRSTKAQAVHVSGAVPDELGLVSPEYDYVTVGGTSYLGPLVGKPKTYLPGDPNELAAGRNFVSIKVMMESIDETTWTPGQARAVDGGSLDCYYAFLKRDVPAPSLQPSHARAAADVTTTAPLDASTAEVCVNPTNGKLAHIGFDVRSGVGSELIGAEIATNVPVNVTVPQKLEANPDRVLKKFRKARDKAK
jgi:hypothetical protein